MTTNGATRPINTSLILTFLIINTKYINLTIGNIIINYLDAHYQLISMNPFTKRRNIVLSCCSFILSNRVNISEYISLYRSCPILTMAVTSNGELFCHFRFITCSLRTINFMTISTNCLRMLCTCDLHSVYEISSVSTNELRVLVFVTYRQSNLRSKYCKSCMIVEKL